MASFPGTRQAMAWVAVVCAAVLATACGSIPASGAGSTATTPPAGSTTTATAPAPQPGTSSAATTAPAAQPGPCSTAALRVTLGSKEGAAAGHFYRTLDFTNISGTSCTLYGYPGVSFVTAISGGSQIGAAASRSPASKLPVVLAPGKKAHAVLDLLDVLNFPASKCAATDAHWIKVYPPNQFSASYVAWTAKVCSKPTTVYLSVAPVRHGG